MPVGSLRIPKFISPQFPLLSAKPPEGEGWIHEIKHDSYRTLIVIDRGQVRAFTRNGNDWTRAYKWRVGVCRFRDIAAAIQMPGRIGEKFAAMAIERLNRRHYF
jgi:bifunctional non-homologous end joining protein LigD